MKFMLLLHGDEAAEAALSEDEVQAILDGHNEFGRRLREGGATVSGEALAPSDTATIVGPGGEVTDGPFTETREQIGGFYVIDCADLDAALGYAKQVPHSPGLVVEVRPVLDL